MSDEREALIERGARAYYEWACCGTEGSRWDDEGPHQEGARRFARERSAVFLDAFLGDRAALLATLGMVRTNGVCTKCGWSGEVTDDPTTWLHDGCNYAAIQIKESWAARVSEETP